jgi:hypothetical protein
MSLAELLRGKTAIEEIAEHLDQLDQNARIAETHALSGSQQMQLYECAGDAPLLDLEFFVPKGVPDDVEVIHHGKNSQPLFRTFQKRWCRPKDLADQLFGYNETPVRSLIGPGYFVAHPTGQPDADPRGAIVVDYFMVPERCDVAGWPEVRPNSRGLQRFVYDQTRDYMRGVSRHVSIGIAYRKESRVMGTFVLCRDESAGG